MAFNGSGVFSLVAGNPVVTGTVVSSTWANNSLSDIATNGLTNVICKDGQTTVTANIPFAGFRLTGIGLGTAVTDAARVDQTQNATLMNMGTTSGTNTITGSVTPTPSAYVQGQIFRGVAGGTNTGAATLNVSSLGAGAIHSNAAILSGGELLLSAPFEVMVTTASATPVFGLLRSYKSPSIIVFTTATTSAQYNVTPGTRWMRVRVQGAGGGGGGASANNGNPGSATMVWNGGSVAITATPGTGGAANGGNAGQGGSASGGDINIGGSNAQFREADGAASVPGGQGADSQMGRGGVAISAGTTGGNATGFGSGGAGGGAAASNSCGQGGGSAGYVEKIITSCATAYLYTVATGGTGGAAGTNAGGNGADGIIIVEEYYQ